MLHEDVRWCWGLRMSAEMTKLHKLVELQYMTIFIPSQSLTQRPSLMPNHLKTINVAYYAIHKKELTVGQQTSLDITWQGQSNA